MSVQFLDAVPLVGRCVEPALDTAEGQIWGLAHQEPMLLPLQMEWALLARSRSHSTFLRTRTGSTEMVLHVASYGRRFS